MRDKKFFKKFLCKISEIFFAKKNYNLLVVVFNKMIYVSAFLCSFVFFCGFLKLFSVFAKSVEVVTYT